MAVSVEGTVGSSVECFSPLVRWQEERVKRFSESVEYTEAWRATHCAASAPLSHSNWWRVPHNKHGLKQHVRSGVSPDLRKRLWLDVVGVVDEDSVLFAKAFGEPVEDDKLEQVGMMFGWPFDMDTIIVPSLPVKPSFKAAFDRVLTGLALEYRHRVTASPLLPVLVHIGLHLMDEWECFALVNKLLQKRGWLDRNAREMKASKETLKWLCNTKLDLHSLQHMRPAVMSPGSFLDGLVEYWYAWPFYKQPFWIAVRVLDLYLVEGPKVLYRLALAGLKLLASNSQGTVDVNIEEAMMVHLSELGSKAPWFQAAFTIPRLPWSSILKQWGLELTKIPPMDHHDQIDGPTISSYKLVVTPDSSSEILTSHELWQSLWTMLPLWVTCEQPQCVFRTSRDGYNLRTLYRKCEHMQPIILVLRTTNSEVFGSFICNELVERHGAQFFGSGETFLFTLLPTTHSYQWSGETDLIVRGTDQELVVGSGGGAFGLWLDGELDRGVTSTCQAFLNPPLTGGATDFSCAAVEVPLKLSMEIFGENPP